MEFGLISSDASEAKGQVRLRKAPGDPFQRIIGDKLIHGFNSPPCPIGG
jgi:hypothetical protein